MLAKLQSAHEVVWHLRCLSLLGVLPANQHFSQVGDAGIESATSAVWTLEDLLKGD
jgi:hypothetical protein